MLSKYNYYTGIIFKAYTYGTGDAIATGGRYDNLVGQFGKEASAIGLAIVVDQLMLALSRQKLLPVPEVHDTLILYTENYRKQAIELAGHFRKDKINTILQIYKGELDQEKYLQYASRMSLGGLLFLDNDKEITVIDAATRSIQKAPLEGFLQY